MAPRRSQAETNAVVTDDRDYDAVGNAHESKRALSAAVTIEQYEPPASEVTASDLSLGMDPNDFEAVELGPYKQPELPFLDSFKAKAHLWQFSWAPWAKREKMNGEASVGYSQLVRKGGAYRGHKFSDMFPDSAFDAAGQTLIGEGSEFDPNTMSTGPAQVLCIRPRIAFEKEQEAVVKRTEARIRQGGDVRNPELRNIIDSSQGDVMARSDEPGKPIHRTVYDLPSRWD